MGNAPKQLHDAGQSLWLDYITRDVVKNGTIERYVDELSLTGLTSNPTIFDKALDGGDPYDEQIGRAARGGQGGRGALLRARDDRPARCRRPLPRRPRRDRRRRRVRLARGLAAARLPRQRDGRGRRAPAAPRRIARTSTSRSPARPRGWRDQRVDRGRDPDQRDAALRRRPVPRPGGRLHARDRTRIERGDDPAVASVASIFVSRWDVAVADRVPDELKNRLGVAVAIKTYVAYRQLLASERWQRLAAAGARPQRLLFASTGTKDPSLPKTKYVVELAAPDTVDTMPEETLLALAEEDDIGGVLADDGGDNEELLGPLRSGRDRPRRARRAAPVRGCREVRGLLERHARRHREQAARSRGHRLNSQTPAPAAASGMRSLPGWQALIDNRAALTGRHLRDLFAADPDRGERLVVEAEGLRLDYSKNRIDARDDPAARRARRRGGAARANRGDVPRRADQRHRGPLGAPRRAADAPGPLADRRRPRRRRRRPRGARPHGCVQRPDPQRRLDGPHRQADPQRRQHRHRRLRPRPGDGLPGAAPLLRPRPDGPLRLERRRDRLRREDP